MTRDESTTGAKFPNQYRITIQGHLDLRWAKRFEGMEICHKPDGNTILTGNIPDQAALYGLLIKCRDMGLTLVSINRA